MAKTKKNTHYATTRPRLRKAKAAVKMEKSSTLNYYEKGGDRNGSFEIDLTFK